MLDGLVDLSKFEMEIFGSKNVYKIIREGNENQNKRIRPSYRGP